jgi:hypothetical protein
MRCCQRGDDVGPQDRQEWQAGKRHGDRRQGKQGQEGLQSASGYAVPQLTRKGVNRWVTSRVGWMLDPAYPRTVMIESEAAYATG